MPRPARYTVDALLDAAAQLLAQDGVSAVTMSAVARSAGAPSGSVYHRFPSRAALCGELWVRTEERFQEELIEALSVDGDAQQRCVNGALRIVQWCREHPVEAQVLLAGPNELGLGEWPDPVTGRRKRLQRKLRKVLSELPDDLARVNAAIMDVPAAIVRRHLRARQSIPATADAIVEDCARALIAPS
ncbi:TetR/AcrR family transcriptional regulator; helix-turn-helix transcriptional regulator [Mycobacterium sp. SMC-8]|uniref:TetR/AcrR family transcriptional regulator n=1 Tax=Mycobacterium sp. SMC-8 TaxID=2857060 RepID=UPI0021B4B6E6|nr:TetR/AcrR family transcriptional regulator [Mycobacterium sp. SMC-8]UXA14829.1 TetR/AcrR family transcriptional regulator; helix-turn-helix transcriptional regulator [Mycobacterium sp. SMC-8]